MQMEPVNSCPICGAHGDQEFEEMRDHMFNVEGKFTLRRCSDSSCATLWLDPRPVESDIHLAYSAYYTHMQTRDIRTKGSSIRRLLKNGKKRLEQIIGLQSQRERHAAMYLDDAPRGRVLDVGCGSCLRLEDFRKQGWDVYGQDVDPALKTVAEAREIPVFIGPLTEAGFSDASFDAIVSNHAIEHMYDPGSILRECRRILKPGGVLVVTTPNSRSESLKRFGGHWAGLDAPRHLVIFSTDSLRTLAQQAGFGEIRTWSTNVRTGRFSLMSSSFHQAAKTNQPPILGSYTPLTLMREEGRQYLKTITQHSAGDTGDECVLWAIRQD